MNQRKILRILPILTYFKKKGFLLYFVKYSFDVLCYDSNFKLRSACDTAESKLCSVGSTTESKLRGSCHIAESKLCGVGITAESKLFGACDPVELKLHDVACTAESQISTLLKQFWGKNTAESKLHSACDTAELFYSFIQPTSNLYRVK